VLPSTLETQPPLFQTLENELSARFDEVRELRWDLHRHPCLSGDEKDSADRIRRWLSERVTPSEVVEGLGETGLAVVFDSGRPGSTVLLRSELDALPLDDLPEMPHRSTRPGIAHKCGHDGHSAIISAVGLLLERFPLPTGRAVLLYQPAEETGRGARQVIADPRFSDLRADWAFGLHNVPGLPLGQIRYRTGPFCPASEGIEIRLVGGPSHAGEPHNGRNPARAMAQMITSFCGLPTELGGLNAVGLVTPTHLRMGEKDFGLSPGEGIACFTVRAETNEKLHHLVDTMKSRTCMIGSAYGLEVEFLRHDPFSATLNSPEGTRVLDQAFQHLGFPTESVDSVFPWSEDFGEFLSLMPGAFFALGSGEDCPSLHTYEYDFPDSLITRGAAALYTAAWIAVSGQGKE